VAELVGGDQLAFTAADDEVDAAPLGIFGGPLFSLVLGGDALVDSGKADAGEMISHGVDALLGKARVVLIAT
jgi:hypothetical protein